MPKTPDNAGMAARAICESLLLALSDRNRDGRTFVWRTRRAAPLHTDKMPRLI